MTGSGSPFHAGEKAVQTRAGVAESAELLGRRMIQPQMAPAHRLFLAHDPVLVVATTDAEQRPWASLVLGESGYLATPEAGLLVVERDPSIDGADPLDASLSQGRPIGTLAIDFETRTRARQNGRIADTSATGFTVEVDEAYGNCDMYIQARAPSSPPAAPADAPAPHPASPAPAAARAQTPPSAPLATKTQTLSREDAVLIADADTFFIATQATDENDQVASLDASHRGGMPGFVLVAHESLLLFPDYPGNNMYNTLGNLALDERAGLLFVDFAEGTTLQLTGKGQLHWEAHHVSRFPGAQRVIAFTIDEVRRREHAFVAPWQFGDYSPVFSTLPTPPLVPPPADFPAMRLRAVNLAMPRVVEGKGREVSTGIFKQPVRTPVALQRLNLAGDGQADLWGHGGSFRAVYAYPHEHYTYWAQSLGREDFASGQFGENFTIEGVDEDLVYVGDVFRVGTALVEVSQPRIPCFKLALKMGIDGFEQTFLNSGRVGFYFRVLEPGTVGAGDSFTLVGRDPAGMSVRRMSSLLFFETDDLDGARQALSIRALAHGWKGSFEERLAQAQAAREAQGAAPALRPFRVSRKERESDTITSFYLTPADGAATEPFHPGQFLPFALTLADDDGDAPVIRTYSLSDSPGKAHYRVSIKREPAPLETPDVPPGRASNYFHDEVAVGSVLQVGTPSGEFVLDPHARSERAIVLVSAGVGLTPMLSMLNSLVEASTQRAIWFVHGARNGGEHAFGDHVRQLAARYDNVHVHVRYSAPRAQDRMGQDYDSRGRVDMALLKSILPFDDYEFYMVGPTPFMRDLYRGLASFGIARSRIHYEFFGPASALEAPGEHEAGGEVGAANADVRSNAGAGSASDAADAVTAPQSVRFARSGVDAQWTPGTANTLLELAEASGLQPPHSCRSGVCQTCRCRLLEGEVSYAQAPLAAPASGEVLVCIARPTSPVVLDL
ncbi:MAG: MOSC domain-containing protein [Pseudomonadota bacterium]